MCIMHLARALSVAMTYDICTVNQAIHSHARTSPSTVENWQPGTLHAAMEILAAAHMQTSSNHSTPHCTDNSKNGNIATKQQQSHNQIWLQNTKNEVTHSFVLKRPTLVNSASLPVKRDAGPLN